MATVLHFKLGLRSSPFKSSYFQGLAISTLLLLSACGSSSQKPGDANPALPVSEQNPITVSTPAPKPFAFGFAPAQYDNAIYSYQLNRETGEILPTAQVSIAAQTLPISTALSADHRYLFAANYSSNSISSYQINASSGELTLVTHFAMPASSAPGWITAHPRLPVIYVAASGTGMIAVIDIQTDGSLILRNLVSAGPGVTSFAISPDASVLFSAEQNADQITSFAIGASGDLTQTQVTTLVSKSQPNQIELSHSGKFLYSANWGTHSVSAWAVNGDALQSLGPDTDAGGPVFTVNISPDDQFAYAMQPYSNQFSTHAISQDGRLSLAALTARTGAVWMSFFSHFSFLTSWTYHPEGQAIESRDYQTGSGMGSTVKFQSAPHRGMYQLTILE